MFRLLLAGLVALVVVSCSGSDARAPGVVQTARPALWKVSDPDTTVYLFGTIHLLPKGLQWTSPKLNAAMASAQGLVLEVVLDDPSKLGAAMNDLGTSPGLPPLLDRVAPTKRAKLKATVDKLGIPLEAIDRLESWAAALVISSASLRAADLSHAEGAEAQLTAAFRKAGKPVDGLETGTQQLGYFDGLSEAAQRQFLESVADDDADMKREFAKMIAAWRSGDVRRIATSFDEELKQSPELAQVLLHRRNATWAAWVKQRMAQPGTVFVAVGAGHLAGTDSVEALVAQQGFRVTRVQ